MEQCALFRLQANHQRLNVTHVCDALCNGLGFILEACARTATGDVWCWGKEPGDLDFRPPEHVASGSRQIVVSNIGRPHRDQHVWCNLAQDGHVQCGAWGELDIPRVEGNDWSYLSAGISHMCGQRKNGQIACWGWDIYGETQVPTNETWYEFPVEIW